VVLSWREGKAEMRLLTIEKQVEICAHLVEGCGVRATARLCGVDKNTIQSLLLRVGRGCLRLHDRLVRGLALGRIECDELVTTLHTRAKNLRDDDPPEWGALWTYTGFATVSKLLVSFCHGKRTQALTDAFMWDLRRRVTVMPEMVTDGLVLYEPAVARSFGLAIDYAILVKAPSKKGKVSTVPFIRKRRVVGAPDMEHCSTSYVERFNLTIRTQNRRFTRRTNAHSKKMEHHEAHFALLACWYNIVREHSTIGTTPAVMAGIASEPWSLARLVSEALSAEEAPPLVAQTLTPREGSTGAARQLSTGGWLRVIDGGKTKPGIVKVPGAPPLAREKPVKPAPPRKMEQMNLFDLE
jgi:IS1 family transposase